MKKETKNKIVKAAFAMLLITISAIFALYYALFSCWSCVQDCTASGKIFYAMLILIFTVGFFTGIYILFAKRVRHGVKIFSVNVLCVALLMAGLVIFNLSPLGMTMCTRMAVKDPPRCSSQLGFAAVKGLVGGCEFMVGPFSIE